MTFDYMFKKILYKTRGKQVIIKRLDITNLAKDIHEINSGSCKKFLFTMNGKKYVFKQNYKGNFCFGYSNEFDNKHADILEVFSSYFLKKVGCDFSLSYRFASFNGEHGCICPYFKNANVTNEFNFANILLNLENKESTPKNYSEQDEIFSFFRDKYNNKESNGQYIISTEQIVSLTEDFCKVYNLKFDKNGIKQKLDIIAACDFFMSNNDRHWQNILFLEQELNGEKTLTLAPLFDNGQSFGQADFNNFGAERIFSVWQAMGISDNGRFYKFKNNKYLKEQRLLACDIYNACKTNPKLEKIVKNCQTLDFDKLLNDFEKEYDVTLYDTHKQIMRETFEFKKDYYIAATKKLKDRISKQKNDTINKQVM